MTRAELISLDFVSLRGRQQLGVAHRTMSMVVPRDRFAVARDIVELSGGYDRCDTTKEHGKSCAKAHQQKREYRAAVCLCLVLDECDVGRGNVDRFLAHERVGHHLIRVLVGPGRDRPAGGGSR